MKKRLSVEGMSCKHCSGRVTRTLGETAGISDVGVSLEEKEATFECEPGTDFEAVMASIRELGFSVSEK